MPRPQLTTCLLSAAIALACASAFAAQSRAAINRAAGQRITSPADEYRLLLQETRLQPAQRNQVIDRLKKLPRDVQEVIVEGARPVRAAEPSYRLRLDTVYTLPSDIREIILTPTISEFFPADGGRDQIVIVVGTGFIASSQVSFNGAPAMTYPWPWYDKGFCPTLLLFRVPDQAFPLGASYDVRISSGTRTSAAKPFQIVAPRGYRGLHGFSFANVSRPTIPWEVYRNYFGPSAVEFGDGTHRPAAQSWYNAVYRSAGDGGNCYGYSLTSLRAKHWNMAGLLFATWWDANRLDRVWDYASNRNDDQVWRSIQEMQGSQYAEPQHTTLWTPLGNNNPNQAWLNARSILDLSPPHACVMGMTGGGGHAVVVYDVSPDEPTRKLIMYDNNHPYATTETGGPDPNAATVNRGANTFSYGSYTKVATWDLTDLLVAPNLPSAAMGSDMGAAARSAYLVVQRPGQVVQVSDAQGHTYFTGRNETAGANRVAGVIRTLPLGGLPVPASFPDTWLLTDAVGRNLQFDVRSTGGPTTTQLIQKGLITELVTSGRDLRLSSTGLNTPASRLAIPTPGAAGLRSLRLIAVVGAAEERTFEIDSIGGNLTQPLEVALDAARSALVLRNRAAQALTARVSMRRDVANQHVNTGQVDLSLAANQVGVLQPANWQQGLANQGLRLELQTLAGARLEQRLLRPR